MCRHIGRYYGYWNNDQERSGVGSDGGKKATPVISSTDQPALHPSYNSL